MQTLPKQQPDLSGRRRAVAKVIDARLRGALAGPAYEITLWGYHGLRKLAGRDPGRGRLLPDFLIIGAAKAGTTSLHAWLSRHPCVVVANKKEINYFSYNYSLGEDWYRSQFPPQRWREALWAQHGQRLLTGEASPSYLMHPWAPQRAGQLVPQVKLIVTLRDPVDRAYSSFHHRRRDGEEPLESFDAAVRAEDGRLAPGLARLAADPDYNSFEVACWSYLLRSRYAEQLERWFACFGREQFYFVTLENLAAEPQKTLDGVHDFLGLAPWRAESLPRLNIAPRHNARYAPLEPEVDQRLREYFRPHNQRLYEMVGFNFGWER
jgi:hypothetical protein